MDVEGETSMKRIVIDAREFTTSTGRYVSKLVEYLEKIDHEHEYVVLLYPKDLEAWQPTNPNFTKMVCPYKEFTFAEQFGLLRQLNSLKPDLVHFGMVQQPLLYVGKVITTMHDLTTARFKNPSKNQLVFTLKQQVYKAVNWFVPHKDQHIIVPSDYVKEDVATFAHITTDKITVTYESADKIPDTPAPIKSVEGKHFIMYVGRPTPHKNLDRLVEAFKILQTSQPDLHLVLAGKKDVLYSRIEEKTKSEQIANIYFTDLVSEGQLRWLYEHCAAYVFPSLSEGFGLPGLEAMAHGAPVVASSATCIPEVLGEAAMYFDPLNVQDMVRAIEEVIKDKNRRMRLIELGYTQAAKYSWQRMAEQTLVIYKQVLGEK